MLNEHLAKYGSKDHPIVVDLNHDDNDANLLAQNAVSHRHDTNTFPQSKRLIAIGSPLIFPNGIAENFVSDYDVTRTVPSCSREMPTSSLAASTGCSSSDALPQTGENLPPRHRRATKRRLGYDDSHGFAGRNISRRVSEHAGTCSSAPLERVPIIQSMSPTATVDYSESSRRSLPASNSQDQDDPFGHLNRDIYSDSDSDSDSTVHPPPERPTSPKLGEHDVRPDIELQIRLGFHLSKTFELDGFRTNRIERPRPNGTQQPIRQPQLTPSRDLVCTSRHSSREDVPRNLVISLPKGPHNKPRRILRPQGSFDLPIITVSMRADIQFFDVHKRIRISKFSIPNNATYRHVVDAVTVGDTAVICYGDGPCQASLVRFRSHEQGRTPFLTDIGHDAHKLSVDATAARGRRAVSCLAARGTQRNVLQFFTGGYDKTLKLWSVRHSDLATTSETLTGLPTIPEALAFRDKKLIVGSSRRVLMIDLEHLSSAPISSHLSNVLCQIHVHSQAPNLTILEVDNLDFQVHIFDDRVKRGFDRAADCYFGARQKRTLTKSNRGDTNFSLFVKGYDDGTVKLWDFRNAKKPVLTKEYQNIRNVVHTVFTGNNILCYGENNLTLLDI